MTQPLGHEKLIVYQKGKRFVGVRSALLDGLPRRAAANRAAICSDALQRCSQRSQRSQSMTLNTLTRKLNRTLNRRPYSDTLNRPTFPKRRVVDVAAPRQHQSTHRFCGV
jgi:hypothetical protein